MCFHSLSVSRFNGCFHISASYNYSRLNLVEFVPNTDDMSIYRLTEWKFSFCGLAAANRASKIWIPIPVHIRNVDRNMSITDANSPQCGVSWSFSHSLSMAINCSTCFSISIFNKTSCIFARIRGVLFFDLSDRKTEKNIWRLFISIQMSGIQFRISYSKVRQSIRSSVDMTGSSSSHEIGHYWKKSISRKRCIEEKNAQRLFSSEFHD